MKYQCRHKNSWGRRCTKSTIKGKDYCAEHSKPNFSQTYAIGQTTFSPEQNPEVTYKSYLTSESWKLRAKEERSKNPNCTLCNRRGMLHVHHRTYARLGNEKEGDLVVLCEDCHELFHQHYVYQGQLGYFVKK